MSEGYRFFERATATVAIRDEGHLFAKYSAMLVDGRRVHLIYRGPSDHHLYPGEDEWDVDFRRTKGWPSDAPTWFASGDIKDIRVSDPVT